MEEKDLELYEINEKMEEYEDDCCEDNESEFYIAPLVVLDEEKKDSLINHPKFTQGLLDSLYYSGMITGLMNLGMSNVDSMTLLLGKINIDFNLELAKNNNDTSIECSKNQQIMIEKNQM
jgi:hypothetical protein